MRHRGSDGRFTSSSSFSHQVAQSALGSALIEHAGNQAVGLFTGIDPTLLAGAIQSAGGGVARVVRRGGSVQVWMQSTEHGVGERVAKALVKGGVAVELRASA